ncbi:unnamed protein product [Adineta ricciae]|uniref:Uncharacterized protein n=1 Tax=Adineta ricciae TaxID=249248 RepID=A0A814G1F3_ADIRI|nr:unnamed protein product [Adineta ricciae]
MGLFDLGCTCNNVYEYHAQLIGCMKMHDTMALHQNVPKGPISFGQCEADLRQNYEMFPLSNVLSEQNSHTQQNSASMVTSTPTIMNCSAQTISNCNK